MFTTLPRLALLYLALAISPASASTIAPDAAASLIPLVPVIAAATLFVLVGGMAMPALVVVCRPLRPVATWCAKRAFWAGGTAAIKKVLWWLWVIIVA